MFDKAVLDIYVNITTATRALNAQLELMKKGMRYGIERLTKLSGENLHIECLMVHGQLLEHGLKNILRACKMKREVAGWVGAPDPLPVIKYNDGRDRNFEDNFAKLENRALGTLIGLFRSATGKVDLANNLEEFNNKRVDMVHKAFDGTRDIEEVNTKAKEFIRTSTFGADVDLLRIAFNELQDEIMKLFPKLDYKPD